MDFSPAKNRQSIEVSTPHEPRRVSGLLDSPWCFPVCLAAVITAVFFDALRPDAVFAYRDSLHFYPPLYKLVRDEWLAGRVPLWNPLLNGGQPLAGMGTSGAFYPPQMILSILLPDGLSLTVLAIFHLALAATASYLLARRQGCSRPAATVAGLAFALSGSVLFQIYNPIYAAGAAWLAWAVYAGWRLLNGAGVGQFLLLAVTLAMAVLSGDPQSAYHTGIVLGLMWLTLPGHSFAALAKLGAAAALAGGLSLVQIALTAEFTGDSSRALSTVPQSLWEVPGWVMRGDSEESLQWYDQLIGHPPPQSWHYESMYAFSLHVWRVVELFWPQASGPVYYRWPVTLGIDSPGSWVNSLYAGILPVAAMGVALVTPPRRMPSRLSWAVVLGVAFAASLGGLGLVGLGRGAVALASGDSQALGYRPGDEVGGLYWLLTVVAPGYAGFRYPSKWLTVFALAFAQLAALVLARLDEPALRRRLATTCLGLAATMGAVTAALTAWAAIVGSEGVLPGAPGDPRRAAAVWVVIGGAAQAAIVAIAAAWVLRGSSSVVVGASLRLPVRVAIVLLAAADLAIAGRSQVFVEPFGDLARAGDYLDSLRDGRRADLAAASAVPRMVVWSAPPKFVDHRDPNRFTRWTGMAMRGHVPWLHGWGVFGEPSTALPATLKMLIEPIEVEGRTRVPRRVFDQAAVEYFLVPLDGLTKADLQTQFADWSAGQKLGDYEGPAPVGLPLPRIPLFLPGEEEEPPVALVIRNESALPRVRIVRDVLELEPVTRRTWQPWLDRLRLIAFPSPALPGLAGPVVITQVGGGMAGPSLQGRPRAEPEGSPAVADECRIVRDESQRVVIECTLSEPGVVVLADTFHPDWKLFVTTADGPRQEQPVLRANQIQRACRLPTGRHLLEYEYRSRTFDRTVWITLGTWATLAMVVMVRFFRGR